MMYRFKHVFLFTLFVINCFAFQGVTAVANGSEFTEDMSDNTSEPSENSSLKTTTSSLNNLLEKLAINQGKGLFSQEKFFSFMSVPISSTGRFIVNEESALWQTESPVFSALLLTPDAIYRRLSLNEHYQLLTENAELSGVLSTIFTGKVNEKNWRVDRDSNDQCLVLFPLSVQLTQLFKQVELCLLNEGSSVQQRQITLTDNKGDKTIIVMTLNSEPFTTKDFEALQLPTNVSEKLNEISNAG